MDWDNLRYFLELSRTRKLTAAARRLEVDHTTVSRRIQALEKSLGAQLFTRETSGYSLTEAGRSLLPQAEAMESACSAIEREREEQTEMLSGHVRIGVTEGYGSVMLAPQLAEFTQRYPHLGIDLLAVPRTMHLSRREADIVITLDRPERGPFIITRLTDYVLRLYASPSYLQAHAPITSRETLRSHRFVSYIDDLLYSKELFYLDEIGKPLQVSLRSTSILAQQQAAAAGAGIAILPAFAAEADPRLQPILSDSIEFTRTFWMLMPIELKDIARMKATWTYLREMADSQQDLLLGRA
ncbi:Transcriptional regulator, LysR family [Pseudomonas marincola]|jgi:DNA-binding transcriptional LysR family regulator|uniref:LysR family transcriptional regulator n=2 Tax=Pseudomonas TaxID=286 RepID=A0A653E5W2_9PSED|nr:MULTISPECIES: LysR family transcriptional regulator [Pseudomonas]OEO24853.1 LysR family transcriptional regulator [Pseudomonas sp. J237]CAE6901581.1 Transcriptional regulator, LysR family [Pseudomonas marincola]